MIKKLFTLYKLGRKLAKSDVLNIVSKFKKPPLAITILFQILSFSFSSSEKSNLNENEGAAAAKEHRRNQAKLVGRNKKNKQHSVNENQES